MKPTLPLLTALLLAPLAAMHAAEPPPDPWQPVTAAIEASHSEFPSGLTLEVMTPAGVVFSRNFGGLLKGICFRARRTGNGQNRDGRRGVRGYEPWRGRGEVSRNQKSRRQRSTENRDAYFSPMRYSTRSWLRTDASSSSARDRCQMMRRAMSPSNDSRPG